jgi:hypothetical protein
MKPLKSPAKVLLAGLVAAGCAAPGVTWAAGAGHPMGVQSFGVQRQVHPQMQVHPQAFANRGRHFFGYGYYGGPYSTLLSGTYDSAPAPDDAEAGLVPPPPYGVPYYEPPRPCVRPLLIHIAPMRHQGKLPRVVYGTPDIACPG